MIEEIAAGHCQRDTVCMLKFTLVWFLAGWCAQSQREQYSNGMTVTLQRRALLRRAFADPARYIWAPKPKVWNTMRHSISRQCLVAFAALTGFGCMHCAAGEEAAGFYVGASFGEAKNDYHTQFVDDQVAQSAASANATLLDTTSKVQRDSHAWWVDAGYLPWGYVGFEAAFLHLAELSHRFSGMVQTQQATLPFISTTTVTSHGPALLLLARVPLTDSLELNGRIGDYLARTTLRSGLEFQGSYPVDTTSGTKSSLAAAVGLAYSLAGHWSVRVDYLRVHAAGDARTGTYDMDLATAGIAFAF